MIILLVTLFFLWMETDEGSITPKELSGAILLFSFILCIIFIVVALRLNFLVGKSIIQPVGYMLDVVEKVKEGDFTQKIRVLSNDEIGIF